MAKEDVIKVDGVVVDCLPAAMFRVKLLNDQLILGHISGRMRKNEIRLALGDRVGVEFSPYDLTKGRIVQRL